MIVKNTLAYYNTDLITFVKSFILQPLFPIIVIDHSYTGNVYETCSTNKLECLSTEKFCRPAQHLQVRLGDFFDITNDILSKTSFVNLISMS
jgi:hypothetical protein